MKFLFQKMRTGKYDRLVVERDGRTEEVPCPKIGGIPHDMVHFAVENVMRMRGYLRKVAAGEALSLRMTPDVVSDQMERLVEVMQADANSGFPAAADLIALYRVTCDARGVVPFDVTNNDIAAIRAEMRGLEKMWDATAPGSTLALSFDDMHEHAR
jgi:hypothetical protein